FYNIKTPTTVSEYPSALGRWTPKTTDKPFNYNFGLSGGKSFVVGEEGRLNLFATLSHTNDYAYKKGFERVVGSDVNTIPSDYYDVKKYAYTTNTSGL